MSIRIFFTGVSGYVGGQLGETLSREHPEFEMTTLVRTEEQAQKVQARWPHMRIVVGDLDSHDLLVREAAASDVVLQIANSDHIPSIKSLIQGLSQRSSPKTGGYIHVSGAGSVFEAPLGYGKLTDRVWDDVTDLNELISLPESALHAVADQTVIAAHKSSGVKTALVTPPCIYGTGEGPISTTSLQLPSLVEAIEKRGKAFTIEEGRNVYSIVHVKDVVDALIFLTEEASKPNGGKAVWGEEAYYYVENGEYSMADITKAIAEVGYQKGVLRSPDIEQISTEEATKFHPWAPLIWGMNARVKGSRLEALGWTPKKTMSVLEIAKQVI